MRRRGFTLLELAVVCLILALLLGVGYGQLARYRANTALNAAVDRLVAELGNAKGQAQAFGLPHTRNNLPLPSPLPAAQAQGGDQNPLGGRIVEKVAGNGLSVTKQWFIGDTGGTGRRLEIRFQNLPRLPMTTTTAGDQGCSLEVVQAPGTVLASVAFEADGRPNLIDSAVSGAIYLGLGPNLSDPEYEITISPIGAISKQKLR